MIARKAKEVRYEQADFAATARCRGSLDRSGTGEGEVEKCEARFSASIAAVEGFGNVSMDRPGAAKKWARKHAQEHPGHEVVVERKSIAVYWTEP
jgi:hypothetical protein